MNKLIAVGIAAIMLATVVPSTEASRTEYVNYITSGMFAVEDTIRVGPVISCSGEPHSLTPHDWDQEEILESPDGWLFSGEPECAPNDIRNTVSGENEPGGIGGGHFLVYPADALSPVVANTNDDVFGVGNSYLYLTSPPSESTCDETGANCESDLSEGCGPQLVIIPADPQRHWQSDPSDPYYITWARVPTVGVTADLEACFSSVGVVEAIIG